jgi:hypothetical protein
MAKKKRRKVRVYEIPQLKVSASTLILGCDPGSANFGIALVGLVKGKIKVYANAVLMAPVNDLITFNSKSSEFLEEIDQWMQFKPSGLVAERFQTRGNGGPLIEQVSSMLGLLKGRYQSLPVKLTIASAWKNRVQKRFEIDLKDVYAASSVQPHQIDAALIAVYGLEEGLGTHLDYSVDDIVAQVEKTSLVGKRGEKWPMIER